MWKGPDSRTVEGVNPKSSKGNTMTAPARRLTRSTTDKWIAGVCGGIAEYFGWSPAVVRLLFVLSCLLPGPQFVIYLVLWLLVPKRR